MDTLAYTTRSCESCLDSLHVAVSSGLTDAEVRARRTQFGTNALKRSHRRAHTILLRQVRSPFIYLLFGAGILAYLLGQRIDTALILGFIILNTALGFFQEYRSEQTLELLKGYTRNQARVRRRGTVLILPSEELVPGDVVLLETGDRVPADVRLVDTRGLTVDESMVTGESVPVQKTTDEMGTRPQGMHQAQNVCFAGTMILKGTATALVVATGSKSSLGSIVGSPIREQSTFERSIGKFSTFILKLVAGTLVAVVFLHIILNGNDTNVPDLILFAIALAVGVIPEALPVVITFSLSRGARLLTKKHVVVRRLSAVEDLGGIEVLCTDKTGTITENKLAVAHIYGDKPTHLIMLANAGADPNDNRKEPFDAALYKALEQADRAHRTQYTNEAALPFDPETRINATVVQMGATARMLIVRGAPEAILARSHVTHEETTRALGWSSESGTHGERVLAIATRRLAQHEDAHSALESRKHLVFEGLISFKDPIKPSAVRAIRDAQHLGLMVKVITGDSPEVAGAVAHDIGLIEDPTIVLTGAMFHKLSQHERHEAVRSYHVFARIDPQQKREIVELLGESYEVGFLGEGINDIPALKTAGVSLVVQSASDMARDTADIILLKRSLHVIVEGIREGRTAVVNTSKYIKATLASSFGNFYAVALISLFIDYLPMLPVQLLLLNLVSDFPMIAIAADTVGSREIRHPRSHDVREILLVATVLGLVSTFFDFVFFGLFHTYSPSILQTNWFIGSALTELLFLFSIRTMLPFWKGTRIPRAILLPTGLAILATVSIPFITPLAELFSFTTPTIEHVGIIAVTVLAFFAATESVKLLYVRTVGNVRRLRHL